MKNNLNWDVEITVQHSYPNRKPSDSNCRTSTARYAGFTYEKLIAELEAEKSRPFDHISGKLIAYGEPRAV